MPIRKLLSFPDFVFALFQLWMLPHPFAPDIQPPIGLPIVSPQVLDDFSNVKSKDPPSLVDIPSYDVKMDDVPPLVVHAANVALVVEPVVVSIDHQEQFTTKRKFASQNEKN